MVCGHVNYFDANRFRDNAPCCSGCSLAEAGQGSSLLRSCHELTRTKAHGPQETKKKSEKTSKEAKSSKKRQEANIRSPGGLMFLLTSTLIVGGSLGQPVPVNPTVVKPRALEAHRLWPVAWPPVDGLLCSHGDGAMAEQELDKHYRDVPDYANASFADGASSASFGSCGITHS